MREGVEGVFDQGYCSSVVASQPALKPGQRVYFGLKVNTTTITQLARYVMQERAKRVREKRSSSGPCHCE